MTFVLIGVVDSFDRLRILVRVIAGCFAFFILKALPFIAMTGGAARVFGPPHSMIGDNNEFGLAIDMTVPLFFFLAQTEPNRRSRFFWAFVFIASIPTVFFTYSRGAMIGLSVVLVLMFLQLKQRLVIMPVVLAGIAIAVLFTPAAWKERMDSLLGKVRSIVPPKGDLTRGHSPGAWPTISPLRAGVLRHSAPSYSSDMLLTPRMYMGPHSVYFMVLGELRIRRSLAVPDSGGILFCNFVRSVRKWAKLQGDLLIANYANMFQFSLIGFLTAGLFLGRAYFDYYFTIVACIVILKRIVWAQCLEEPAADLDEVVMA